MIEREKLQHLIENIGIPKLCLILLLGISLIIVSIPSGKTKKNAQRTETTAKEDSTDFYVKKQERRLVNALKHVEGVGKVKVMITVNSSKEAVVIKTVPMNKAAVKRKNSQRRGTDRLSRRRRKESSIRDQRSRTSCRRSGRRRPRRRE